MRRSRLNLFKATSMTISLLGVLFILATVVLLAYFGFTAISHTIDTGAGSGAYYDKIANLNYEYNNLTTQYDSTKLAVDQKNDKNLTTDYDAAKIELIQAQADIDNANSAITSGKSPEEIQNRIDIAQQQLQKASQDLNDVRSKM